MGGGRVAGGRLGGGRVGNGRPAKGRVHGGRLGSGGVRAQRVHGGELGSGGVRAERVRGGRLASSQTGCSRTPRARGQVAIEAALTFPLVVIVSLALIQLAWLHQAQLLTKGAAFHAARAGSVWGGDRRRMEDAARFALLPVSGSAHSPQTLKDAWDRAVSVEEELAAAGIKALRIEVLEPTEDDFEKAEGPKPLLELEHDGPSGRDGPLELQVRVRWLYELSIPLGNAALFTAWFASQAGEALSTSIGKLTDAPLGLDERAKASPNAQGQPRVNASELHTLWSWSRGALPGGGARFFLPVQATYRLRMQSSFQRQWLDSSGAP